MNKLLVVIPARLKSTRLPRKPLLDLAGKPMVVRTFERCAQVFPPEVIRVATDSEEIADVCRGAGIIATMTGKDRLTGTDRVAEVASREGPEVVVSVQGDEPLFDPTDLALLRDAALARPGTIHNGYCEIRDSREWLSRSTPKVVFDEQQYLLSMSRAPIPGSKAGEFDFGFRQVCAYAFPPNALHDFSARQSKTRLEASEDIEILRFLEMGYKVKMLQMSDRSIPVDHPEDVEKVLRVLRGD